MLKRWWSLLSLEFLHQWRSGFVLVGGFAVLLWGVLFTTLSMLPPKWFRLLVAGFVTINGLVTTFYFVAALVLLERQQGILGGMAVTPVRPSDYLMSKTTTLTLLALVETVLITIWAVGTAVHWGWLLLGLTGVGMIYTLVGLLLVSRFRSLTSFLLPSAGVVIILLLPLLEMFSLCSPHWFWWNPVQYPLLLLKAAFFQEARLASHLVLGVLGTLLFAAFLWTRAARAYLTMARSSL